MTADRRPSREIDGKRRTVRQLLAGREYSIDFYPREYRWQTKQVSELIDDLANKFLESHEGRNERSAVTDYGHYFLGSIILSEPRGGAHENPSGHARLFVFAGATQRWKCATLEAEAEDTCGMSSPR